MPWVELLAGLALILGFWRRDAALVTGLLVWSSSRRSAEPPRGHAVDCGCFDVHAAGRSREEQLDDMRWVLVRDIGILLMVFQVLAASRRERSGAVR